MLLSPRSIDLPLPPSINRLWRTGRGRVFKSKRYAQWQRSVGWELLTQRRARISGPVTIVIAAGKPDRRRRDVDNLGKALLDLLVAHQVIADNSMVGVLSSRWDANITPGTVRGQRRAGAGRRRRGVGHGQGVTTPMASNR